MSSPGSPYEFELRGAVVLQRNFAPELKRAISVTDAKSINDLVLALKGAPGFVLLQTIWLCACVLPRSTWP